LQQIAMSARLTTYAGVIEALLQCKNHYKLWNKSFGTQQTGHNTLQNERANWAIVNKSQNGLYLLDSNTKFEMAREGIKPDTWIFPPRMGMYVSMLPEHTSYQQSGPRGEKQLIKQANLTMPTLRGSKVFEIEAFDTDFSGVPVNQLARPRQCGEYFEMETDDNSIWIYSANSDDFEQIMMADAMEAAWNKTKYNNAENRKGCKLLLFRPHQTWTMNSAILCERGEALGYTFHGNHSFLLQTDSLRKLHVGHYTYYSRSVVHDEKRMRLKEDIFCTGYVGGEGHDFFSSDEYQTCYENGNIGTEKQKKSLIAVWVPDALTKGVNNINLRKGEIFETLKNINNEFGSFEKGGRGPSEMEYTADYTLNNSICFRGMQYTKKNTEKAEPVITSVNHGHWGTNIYPRCKNHRIGLTGAHIKEQNHKRSMK